MPANGLNLQITEQGKRKGAIKKEGDIILNFCLKV